MNDIVIAMAKWEKVNKNRPRVAVVTQGKNPVLMA